MDEVADTNEASAKKRRRVAEKTPTRNSKIVELNVGGKTFMTSRETLLSHGESPYFTRLLEAGDDDIAVAGAQHDSEGRLFIDRCPVMFGHILSHLRGSLDPNNLLDKEKRDLINEALYYQLDGLLEDLTRPVHRGYDEQVLSKEDQQIRKQAQDIRSTLKEHPKGAAKQANEALIDLFKSGKCAYKGTYDVALTSPRATVLYQNEVAYERQKMTDRSFPVTIQDFRQKLVEFGGPLLANFPMENIVVAGGSIVRALQDSGRETNGADVDIFIIADDDDTARATYQRILQHVKERNVQGIPHHELLVMRSPFAVTLIVGHPQRHLQIILRRYACIADVIFNFDIDSCQLAYDGNTVWATPSARRALMTGINFVDPERSGRDFETRLAKYAGRGFLAAVPGLDLGKVKESYLRDGIYTVVEGEKDLRKVFLKFKHGQNLPSYTLRPSPITGLSKLLVLSNLNQGHMFNVQTGQDDLNPGMRQLLDRPEQDLLGDIQSPGSSTCYLINTEKLQYGSDNKREWTLPTPPNVPPLCFLVALENGTQHSDSGGGPLLPFKEGVKPRDIYLSSLEGNRGSLIRASRSVCYNFIGDCRLGIDCPRVEDAKMQYPHMYFEAAGMSLQRFLRFPASNDPERNPFLCYHESDWTSDAYDKQEVE
jgi:hypothetical protein